ncbi:MAG: hypothetical protein AABX51_02275 [Nanoarchaeota archaeon]
MKSRFFFILALLVFFSLSSVCAINIGATPGSIRISGMSRGGYAERDILITTNSGENLSGHIDFGGDVKDWLHLENNETKFVFSKSHPYKSKIIIEPPADAQAGNYSGLVSFVTDSVVSVTGTTGSAVRASVAISLSFEVVGEEFVSCSVGAYTVSNTEVNRPVEFSASILNTGNVRISPEITFTFWDQLKRTVVYSHTAPGGMVLPTTRQSVLSRIEHNLPVGQYWLEVSIPDCKTSQELTFSVVERGQIADVGVLDGIFIRQFYEVGDSAEINAVFSNKGTRSVVAQFKGSLYKDNVLVKPMESDELVVSAGEQITFKMAHIPTEEGVYNVVGRVLYNGKFTFEQSGTFSAVPGENSEDQFPLLGIIVYFIILISIIVLVILIRRELRKKRK